MGGVGDGWSGLVADITDEFAQNRVRFGRSDAWFSDKDIFKADISEVKNPPCPLLLEASSSLPSPHTPSPCGCSGVGRGDPPAGRSFWHSVRSLPPSRKREASSVGSLARARMPPTLPLRRLACHFLQLAIPSARSLTRSTTGSCSRSPCQRAWPLS